MDQENFQTLVIDLIREVKDDLRQFRSEMTDRLNRIEDEVRRDRDKLEEVYQSRNTVKIKFGWGWSMAALLVAIVASGITQVFAG